MNKTEAIKDMHECGDKINAICTRMKTNSIHADEIMGELLHIRDRVYRQWSVLRVSDTRHQLALDMSPLEFGQLRSANKARLPLFKNARGEKAHAAEDGSDWSLLEWTGAMAGEAGEALNFAKKLRRGDYGPEGSQGWRSGIHSLGLEIADTVIYGDLAALRANLNLGWYVRNKFNVVSERIKCSVML